MNVFIKYFIQARRRGRPVTAKESNPGSGGEKRRKTLRRLLITLLALVLLVGICLGYLNDYYPADQAALAAFSAEQTVEERRTENGNLIFGTGQEENGLIFYPGGKVDPEAYAPLMRELAAKGVFCVICRMPFRLAILDGDAAEGVGEAWPSVRHWYLGGHSLGGVMAARYLSQHSEIFDGLILLASYSTEDLSHRKNLAVLSVRGSEDGVLNLNAYEKNRRNLPTSARELVIEGGCHAGFGLYGPQRGDGAPSISSEEQIRQTAEAILDLIQREKG